MQYGGRRVGIEVDLGCLGRRREVGLLGGGVLSRLEIQIQAILGIRFLYIIIWLVGKEKNITK